MISSSSRMFSRWAGLSMSILSAWILGVGPAAAVELRLVEAADPVRTVIEIKGQIFAGDARRVADFIERVPRTRPLAVYLNSPGGILQEGMDMGRYFHANAIATFIVGPGASCASACAMAFLGGRDRNGDALRVKGSNARLGFHSFRRQLDDRDYTLHDIKGAMAYAQSELLKVTDYMIAVGADIEFMSLRLSTPAESMYWVPNDQALSLGVHVLDEKTGRLNLPFDKAAADVRTR